MGFGSINPNVTPWESWTPTGSWSSNTTYTGKRRRVGDTFEYQVKVATSGAPTSANLTITLAETIDTAKLVNTAGAEMRIGDGTVADSAAAYYPVGVYYASSTTVSVYAQNASGTYLTLGAVTQAVPITFGASDSVSIMFKVPIVGYQVIHWIKEHFELLAATFGFGGIVFSHNSHAVKIDKVENKQDKYQEDISEIKGILQRLDERTKNL